MALLFEDKVKDNRSAFIAKVIDISDKLDIDPNWLMAAMDLETAGSFSPSIRNSSTGATGLIQFIPSTAQSLGTSTDSLAKMSNVQQLDYVYKYLNQYKSKLLNYIDLYLAIFFPVAMAKDDKFVIEYGNLTAAKVASNNPLYDTNKDGKITVGELKAKYTSRLPQSWQDYFNKGVSRDNVQKFTIRNIVPISISTVVLIGVVVVLFKYKSKIQKLG